MSVQWIKLLPNLILNTFTKNGKQTQRMFGTAETCVGNVCLLWVHLGITGLKPSTMKHRIFFNSYFSSVPPLFFGHTVQLVGSLSPPPPCALSHVSRVQLFATPWTVAHQAPLSMGFSRQEHWSGLPFPLPGDLPGIKPASPTLQADSLPTEPPGKPALFHCQGSTRGHGSESVES